MGGGVSLMTRFRAAGQAALFIAEAKHLTARSKQQQLQDLATSQDELKNSVVMYPIMGFGMVKLSLTGPSKLGARSGSRRSLSNRHLLGGGGSRSSSRSGTPDLGGSPAAASGLGMLSSRTRVKTWAGPDLGSSSVAAVEEGRGGGGTTVLQTVHSGAELLPELLASPRIDEEAGSAVHTDGEQVEQDEHDGGRPASPAGADLQPQLGP